MGRTFEERTSELFFQTYDQPTFELVDYISARIDAQSVFGLERGLTVKSHKTEKTQCPFCMNYYDGATATDENQKAPEPGDILICIDCAMPSILQEGNTRRALTQEESDELFEQIRQERKSV